MKRYEAWIFYFVYCLFGVAIFFWIFSQQNHHNPVLPKDVRKNETIYVWNDKTNNIDQIITNKRIIYSDSITLYGKKFKRVKE